MTPTRALRLRAERLAELTTEELAAVAGADAPKTLQATCLTCNVACMTATMTCF